MILIIFFTNDLTNTCGVHFYQILHLKINDIMAAIVHSFSPGCSHVCNFALVYFIIAHELERCPSLVAFKNL